MHSTGWRVRHLPICLLLFGVPLFPDSMSTGTKMTIHTISGGQSGDRTVYVQGDRRREEFPTGGKYKKADGSVQWIEGPRLAEITRCDLGQTFELNLDAAQYAAWAYPPKPLTKEQVEALRLKMPQTLMPPKPTFRIETTTRYTGERKEMFGHIARHVITTIKYTPLEDGRREPQDTSIEGWYIDLNQQLSCNQEWVEGMRAHTFMSVRVGNQPPEWPEFIDIGKRETGFALQEITTSRGTHAQRDGTKKQTELKLETLVTQFEEGPLDPALFEVPPGFKLVDHIERNPTLPLSIQLEDFSGSTEARIAGLLSL